MTKTAISKELHNIRVELDWLLWCEEGHNPYWRFAVLPYSKRRERLVKTYWALMALQAKG